MRRHLDWFADKGPDGLVFVGEKGAAFRRTTFGRKWRRPVRPPVSGTASASTTSATPGTPCRPARAPPSLTGTRWCAGHSFQKAALVHQPSDEDRQREVAAGPDDLVRAERAKHHNDNRAHHKEEPSAS